MSTSYEKAENFQTKLRGAYGRAFLASMLHKGTAWAGSATITWATVVLMGGFAAQVPISDFVHVTYLVIAIAFLLALALLTSKLVTKKNIYTGSLDPNQLSYDDKLLFLITFIQLISCLIQILIIGFCLSIAVQGIRQPEFKAINVSRLLIGLSPGEGDAGSMVSDLQACLQSCAAAPLSNSTVMTMAGCAQSCIPMSNLQVCLYTFFMLVILTCILALSCLVYIAVEASLWRESLSLKRYHDEVLRRALLMGIVEADEFDVREFLLRSMGEDLVIRNIGSLEVKTQNAGAIKYLYHHPKGVEMVYEGLTAEDTVRQQTAANMPGFWAREDGMEKNTALLSRLAEKLGLEGKTAEAAANSFSALAVAWKGRSQSPLLKLQVPARDGGGLCNVVQRVVDLVLRRRTRTLQVYIRVLDSFFMSESVGKWLAASGMLEEMKAKLMSIIQKSPNADYTSTGQTSARMEPSTRSRTRFLAFSVLDRLCSIQLPAPTSADHAQSSSLVSSAELIARPAIDWPAQAPDLLRSLDSELAHEKFMWYDEADRYKDLCTKFFGDQHSYGAWLPPTGKCEIRGSRLEGVESVDLLQ